MRARHDARQFWDRSHRRSCHPAVARGSVRLHHTIRSVLGTRGRALIYQCRRQQAREQLSARPLGVVFEQRLSGATTEIFVDEVVENGAAAKAGVERGDVLRLCTAVFEVSAPVDVTTWLNPPAKRKVKAYYECDAKPFDKVMDALASHGVQIDTPNGKEDVKFVGLVLQRARA